MVSGDTSFDVSGSGTVNVSGTIPLATSKGGTADAFSGDAEEVPVQVPRKRRPDEPTAKEREDHEKLHEPYRAWCIPCVAGRGRADPHRSHDHSEDVLPLIGFDYGYLGEKKDGNPILFGRDSKQRWYFALPVPAKGIQQDWSNKTFAEHVASAGHRRMHMKTDTEASIQAFKRVVSSNLSQVHGQEVVPQEAHDDSSSNGMAEDAVREGKAKARTLSEVVATNLQMVVKATDPGVAWMVMWAAMTINIGRKGADGRTAWELRHGKKFQRPVADFAELILYQPESKPPSRLTPKFLKGIFLGIVLRSNDIYVGTEDGDVVEARSFKRLPKGTSGAQEIWKKLRGVPWDPKPSKVSGGGRTAGPILAKPSEPVPTLPQAPRSVYLRRDKELKKYGYTEDCQGCLAAQLDLPAARHSDECRNRITDAMRNDPIDRALVDWADDKAKDYDDLLPGVRKKTDVSTGAKTNVSAPSTPTASSSSGSKRPASHTEQKGGTANPTSKAKAAPPHGTKRSISKSVPGEPIQKQATVPLPRGEKRKAEDEGNLRVEGSISTGTELTAEPPIATGSADSNPVSGAGQGVADAPSQQEMEIGSLCMLTEVCTGCSVDSVHLTEVFNPGCFKEHATAFKLSAGGVFDLRAGWNLSSEVQRKKCWAQIQELDPYLVIGSPICGPDSNLHNLQGGKVPKHLVDEAVAHLVFCCKIFLWQIRRHKKFLFERPWCNKGWDRDCVKEVLDQPGVRRVRCDQCCFGLMSQDEEGDGFAQKPTGFMSNCEEILEEVEQVCPNRLYDDSRYHHRHVELLNHKSKPLERYPVSLIKAILRGLRRSLSRSDSKLYSIEPGEMGPNLDEPAVDFSKWRFPNKDKFYDEYTGLEMDPKLVRSGRLNEMEFLEKLGKRVGCEHGIWDVVPVTVCLEQTGKPPVGVRWVEHMTNDPEKPDIRCRLVVQETKRVTTLDTVSDPGAAFASTVPLEAVRLMFSHFMSRPKYTSKAAPPRDDDFVLMFLDISKAHPHAKTTRTIYTRLPAEHPKGGDSKVCGLLKMNLYGAKDAGKNFEDLVASISKEAGARRGSMNSCIYSIPEKDMRYFHYGDDFIISAPRRHAVWMKEQIEKTLIVKDRGSIGPASTDLSRITFLHRIIEYDRMKDVLTFQADPKHANLLIEALGFNERSKGVVTPGVKIPVTAENSELLGPDEAASFRSNCMRLGYLCLDRVDIQYCGKECARGMSAPTVRHLEILKRCVRYLINHPNLKYVYRRQRMPTEFTIYSDTDWAGCPLTRKSTSGTIVLFGSHIIYTQSSTQAPIALSSGEAEFYGCVKAASRALGIRQLGVDLGIFVVQGGPAYVPTSKPNLVPLPVRLYTDSTSALGTACKRGAGKIRHIEIGSLWLQQVVAEKKIAIAKIDGKKNPPDILTKFGERSMLEMVIKKLSLSYS